MFKLKEYVVYPGHGIGTIKKIETKEIFGKKQKFYTIELETGFKVMVPHDNLESIGLRKLCSKKDAKKVLAMLQDTSQTEDDTRPWNRRYRDLIEQVKSGNIFEIANAYSERIF